MLTCCLVTKHTRTEYARTRDRTIGYKSRTVKQPPLSPKGPNLDSGQNSGKQGHHSSDAKMYNHSFDAIILLGSLFT